MTEQFATLLTDGTIREGLRQAWDDSQPGSPDPHEEGGFILKDASGARPVLKYHSKLANDPHFRDYVLFHEYFHGDNGRGVGASHQTGWTGLVAKLLQQSGEPPSKDEP